MNETINYVNYAADDEDETEISLSNMFSTILRKWKAWAACAVVGAVAVGGVMTWRQMQANANRYSDLSEEALQSNLTASQINAVDQLYQRYLSYDRKTENNQQYMGQSILMNMDPNNISTERLEYLVTSNQANLVNSYDSQTLGQSDYDAIAKVMSTDSYTASPKYAYELVSIYSAADGSTSNSMDVESDTDSENIFVGGSVSNQYRDLMEITITAQNKEQAQQIADIVRAAVDRHTEQLRAAGVTVKLEQTSEKYTESVSTDLADQQANQIMKNSDLISQYNTFSSSNIDTLSEDEKNYFDFLVAKRDQALEKVHWKRYAGIGGLAGLAIALVLIVLQYLTDSRFHTADEVVETVRREGGSVTLRTAGDAAALAGDNAGSGLGNGLATGDGLAGNGLGNGLSVAAASGTFTAPLLGLYASSRKKHYALGKAFTHWANCIDYGSTPDVGLDTETRSSVIASRIKNLCGKGGVQKLYLIENYQSKFGDSVRKALEEKLQEFTVAGPEGVSGANGESNHNFRNEGNTTANRSSQEARSNVSQGSVKIEVLSGKPLSSPAAMQALGQCGAAVVIQGIEDTKKAVLSQTLQLCRETGVPVIGIVAVAETE